MDIRNCSGIAIQVNFLFCPILVQITLLISIKFVLPQAVWVQSFQPGPMSWRMSRIMQTFILLWLCSDYENGKILLRPHHTKDSFNLLLGAHYANKSHLNVPTERHPISHLSSTLQAPALICHCIDFLLALMISKTSCFHSTVRPTAKQNCILERPYFNIERL